MPAHQNHPNRQTYYFVTFTCYRWLSLLEKSPTLVLVCDEDVMDTAFEMRNMIRKKS
ncbi:MAG: hypothetical protein KAI29_28550 [Cyclobacteriaceae bacterium]|nr:hypothetical protein [Cyclobacteriaceae bacterium]